MITRDDCNKIFQLDVFPPTYVEERTAAVLAELERQISVVARAGIGSFVFCLYEEDKTLSRILENAVKNALNDGEFSFRNFRDDLASGLWSIKIDVVNLVVSSDINRRRFGY